MGNQVSLGYDPTQYAQIIEQNQTYTVYENGSGAQYQKYLVTHNGNSDFQNSYIDRINNNDQIFVKAFYAGPTSNKLGCTTKDTYHVITQRITQRLSQIQTLRPANAVKILGVVLRGFQIIFDKHGLVAVKDSMIGINQKRRVKVWLNSNFSINQPEKYQPNGLAVQYQQRQMVNNIFDLMNSKTSPNSLWTQLSIRRQNKFPNTFQDALSLFDHYVFIKKIKNTSVLQQPYCKLYSSITESFVGSNINERFFGQSNKNSFLKTKNQNLNNFNRQNRNIYHDLRQIDQIKEDDQIVKTHYNNSPGLTRTIKIPNRGIQVPMNHHHLHNQAVSHHYNYAPVNPVQTNSMHPGINRFSVQTPYALPIHQHPPQIFLPQQPPQHFLPQHPPQPHIIVPPVNHMNHMSTYNPTVASVGAIRFQQRPVSANPSLQTRINQGLLRQQSTIAIPYTLRPTSSSSQEKFSSFSTKIKQGSISSRAMSFSKFNPPNLQSIHQQMLVHSTNARYEHAQPKEQSHLQFQKVVRSRKLSSPNQTQQTLLHNAASDSTNNLTGYKIQQSSSRQDLHKIGSNRSLISVVRSNQESQVSNQHNKKYVSIKQSINQQTISQIQKVASAEQQKAFSGLIQHEFLIKQSGMGSPVNSSGQEVRNSFSISHFNQLSNEVNQILLKSNEIKRKYDTSSSPHNQSVPAVIKHEKQTKKWISYRDMRRQLSDNLV